MLNIAFCDDDQEILNQLQSLLDQYRKDKNVSIQCLSFQSPLELLAQIEAVYDLIFCFWMLLCLGRMESMWQRKSGSMTVL